MATTNDTVLKMVLGAIGALAVAFIAWLRAIVWGHEKRITTVEADYQHIKGDLVEIRKTQTRAFEVMDKGFDRIEKKLEGNR